MTRRIRIKQGSDMSTRCILAVFFLATVLAGSAAEAVPTQLHGRISHHRHYEQTESATDPAPHVLEGFNFVATQEGIDLTGVKLTPPAKPAITLSQSVFDAPPDARDEFKHQSEFFKTKDGKTETDLYNAYPKGTYTFELTFSGEITPGSNTTSYTLGVPSSVAFPSSIPKVTNYNPRATVASLTPTFEFNLFSTDSWMVAQGVSFVILEVGPMDMDTTVYTDSFVYNPLMPMTSFTSPVVLKSGQEHELSIGFFGTSEAKFSGDQTSSAAHGSLSFFSFVTPVPEPGTLLLLGSGLLGGAAWARGRRKRSRTDG